jgi:hypothetical protein
LAEGLPPDEVAKLLTPATAAEKDLASHSLADAEHALALDPRTLSEMSGQSGLANAGLALALQMNALNPRDEIERMIALQLVAMHGMTLRSVRRAHAAEHSEERRDGINAANKCSRTFATLLEALNRPRGISREQIVTVEQVHVDEGGQAIVGNVSATGGRGGGKTKRRGLPHE